MSLLKEDKVVIPSDYADIRKVFKVSKVKHYALMFRRAIEFLITILLPVYFLYYKVFQNKYDANLHICEDSYDRWMECLGEDIAFTPLNRLVIPGTHNSGIYSAAFKARISSHKISDVLTINMFKRLKDILSLGLVGWDTLIELFAN